MLIGCYGCRKPLFFFKDNWIVIRLGGEHFVYHDECISDRNYEDINIADLFGPRSGMSLKEYIVHYHEDRIRDDVIIYGVPSRLLSMCGLNRVYIFVCVLLDSYVSKIRSFLPR
jgi:hypothetical protein